jgi:thiol:disulfide interchange protein DsbC
MKQAIDSIKNIKIAEILKNKRWELIAILFLTAILILIFILVFSFALFAKSINGKPSPEAIRQDLQKMFPRFSISEINETPIPGIYEIVGETGQIIYYSPKGYLIFGEIWTTNGTSITAERRIAIQEKILAKVIDTIPLDKAIKIGEGPKTIIEISDPFCIFCRKVHEVLKNRKDITKYVFFLPIKGDLSLKGIAYIVCSQNPAQKYEEVFSGKADEKIEKFIITPDCQQKVENLLNEHTKVAMTLQVRGTPYFIINKKPVQGANIPLIERLLNDK